jgi:hypothetical protein
MISELMPETLQQAALWSDLEREKRAKVLEGCR